MTIRISKILLPTDFSTFSKVATKYACELAARFDSELHILHMLEQHLSLTPDFGLGLDLPKYVSESKTAAEKKLAGIVDSEWAAGRKVIRSVSEGSAKVEIVRYARDANIDLIVLSTLCRSGLSQLMIGSVAERVVRTAPCPVLTVRPEGHPFVMP